jgi:transcriptional regulator with XRE-family HTH domain
MGDSSRKLIGRNVKAIRKALGLSQLTFSILTGISKASIINIESGKKGYNLNLLDNIIAFSRYSLNDLSNPEFIPENDLREILAKIYKNHPTYFKILNQTPEIVYAVINKLLKDDFLNSPKEINDVKKYFEQFGWFYKGPSISNALKRMPKLVEINKHSIKKNTNIYLKK